MSARVRASGADGACARCLRRSWLLSALSGPLDLRARDRDRLMALLGLDDERLIAAVGGRRRAELEREHAAFAPARPAAAEAGHALCRHADGYPLLLRTRAAPAMLHASGPAGRLRELAGAPAVALVGSRRPSDYGVEMARSLARGLSASGVTVVATGGAGIAAAALAGALEGGGRAIAVSGDGLDVRPAARRALLARVTRMGCAVSELPAGARGRRWGQLASERVVVGMAALTIVVEATETAEELAPARIAVALGRGLAALPGRVSSPLSCGTNALLCEGASALRGAQDALELLHRAGERRQRPVAAAGQPRSPRGHGVGEPATGALEPRLARTLELVATGFDTPELLSREDPDEGETLLALSELELLGLLRRCDGGRYVPRRPWRVDS